MNPVVVSLCCCCLLATVAQSVNSANLDLRQLLKRSVWQRTKRDLTSLSALKESELGQFVRPEDVKDSLLPHSRTGISVRTKRSKNSINQSRKSGCSLGTCTVHDLAYRLHQLNNKLKISSAPIDKLGSGGYGRRRRSVPERRVSLRREGSRLRAAWSGVAPRSQLYKLEELLRRT
ncbi:adrenomedullin a [Brachyhypopomus gauderio]|uniref:adrenomedullin a n=1 Tax=Brachyhypopomus gauderio TaxID=698409 RepID=UPI004041A786